ncbi:hypothetical protein OAF53_00920 [Akkermansiaceae bacterium]|nr:hypothetical protein [Akkermansiaceae bacterium]
MHHSFDDAGGLLGGSGYRALFGREGDIEKGFEYDSTSRLVRILTHTGLSADRLTFFAALSERPQLLGICVWRKDRGNPGLVESMGEEGGC